MKSETPRNDALRKCAAANPKHLIEIMLRKHEQLEIELNELAAAARHYWHNSIPSAEHMAEWQKLKDVLATMPNVRMSDGL